MKQTNPNPSKSTFQWLGTGLLALIALGLAYLLTGGRLASRPGQVSSLPPTPTFTIAPAIATLPTATASPQPTELPTPSPTAPPAPLQLTVIHTNDTWGYLLPCG